MSYEEAMKAAGADVLEFKQFGSYQGDWWAKVRYKDEQGWVTGSYGSCRGCDAFRAEFGWNDEDCGDYSYNHQDDCPACQEAKRKYQDRLADFGRGYLDDMIMTQEKAEEESARNIEWDSDAQEMLDWIKANR